MSLRTSQENFQKAFKEEKKNLTMSFLSDLKNYLKVRKHKNRCGEILECINNNTPLAAFLCRNDICEELEMEMLKREIPFVIVTNKKGENGFVIRSDDRGITNETIKEVLGKLGKTCDVVTGEELKSFFKDSKKNGLLAVNGLSYKEMRLLEKLCRKKGFLDYIAQDKMSDGTYRFMVQGEKAVEYNNLAITLFELVMMIEGKNKFLNAKKIDNELKVENLRINNFGRGAAGFKPIYLVGSGNQFVKIDQNKFTFGHAVQAHGKVNLVSQFELDNSRNGYASIEASYINRIQDPAATMDINEVYGHFNIRDEEKDNMGFGLTDEERNNLLGENLLVSAIMSSVISTTYEDDIMNVPERWVEKTEHITSEAGRLLSGIINDQVPEGYSELDLLEARDLIDDYDLDLKDYESVAEVMTGLIITDEENSLVMDNTFVDEQVNHQDNNRILSRQEAVNSQYERG